MQMLLLLATSLVTVLPLRIAANCFFADPSPFGLGLEYVETDTPRVFPVPADATGLCTLEAVFPSDFEVGGNDILVNILSHPARRIVGTLKMQAGTRTIIDSFAYER
ncbi:hypothetical protein PspLS_05410 [Pyricularia sp. CBS 133598]|nr:hypothetical protein PspLS_05410 [Pyricularia sp. CBS 133598]